MKEHSRFAAARKFLLFWCLFIGLGAVAGAAGMLAAPDGSALGMQGLLPFFQVLPFAEALFQDFVFPGIALLMVNGIPNLIAAGLLLAKKPSGIVLGGTLGVTLMLWISIQFVIFPANFMSTSYFIFGLIQGATGFAAWVFGRQERFSVSMEDYPNIGKNPSQLVAYFSRLGYTKKLAFETANSTGAMVYEVVPKERTKGTLGFWWCGRFGMHGWAMPVEKPELDFEAYDKVTICSPIWVFGLAGPMKSFCLEAAGKIRRADYILVHFQGLGYENVVREMDEILGLTHGAVRSVRNRWGRMKDLTV